MGGGIGGGKGGGKGKTSRDINSTDRNGMKDKLNSVWLALTVSMFILLALCVAGMIYLLWP